MLKSDYEIKFVQLRFVQLRFSFHPPLFMEKSPPNTIRINRRPPTELKCTCAHTPHRDILLKEKQ